MTNSGLLDHAYATPEDRMLVELAGGPLAHQRLDGIVFTPEQIAALACFYGFDLSTDERIKEAQQDHDAALSAWRERQCDESYTEPRPELSDEDVLRRWYESGDVRNLLRHAQHDGLRLMAFLAQWLGPSEDPVALVANALRALGHDVTTSLGLEDDDG